MHVDGTDAVDGAVSSPLSHRPVIRSSRMVKSCLLDEICQGTLCDPRVVPTVPPKQMVSEGVCEAHNFFFFAVVSLFCGSITGIKNCPLGFPLADDDGVFNLFFSTPR
jgi:hypothetical protein